MQAPHWMLWIDGSATPNPGRMRTGGIAWAPGQPAYIFQHTLPERGCNNEAEMRAALHALQWLQGQACASAVLYTDSQLLAQQMATPAPAPIVRLAPWVALCRAAALPLKGLVVRWVPRHRNGMADALARCDEAAWHAAVQLAHTKGWLPGEAALHWPAATGALRV